MKAAYEATAAILLYKRRTLIIPMPPRVAPEVDIPSIPEQPLAFTCPTTEFVDRELILDDLYRLTQMGLKPFNSNYALIGPRRIGKTAIIERLYNWLWSHQREVIPLYFSLRTYAGKPALDTLTRMGMEFVNQYLSFKSGMDDAQLRRPSLEEALEQARADKDAGLEKALIRYMTAIEVDSEVEILEKLADLPRTIADTNRCAIAVFIDEFQVIMQMLDRDKEITDLRATFKDAVESPRCNFFVTGSAVTIMREQILGQGPLFGRFMRMSIPPLEQYWGLELVRKLAAVLEFEMNEELGAYLVEYTNAHAYYIHCFMAHLSRVMVNAGKTSATRDLLSSAISAEETEGELSNFFDQLLWGFTQQYKPIAWPVLGFIAEHDADTPIDHGALYQFLTGLKDDYPWLAKYAELETAIEMLKDLTEADILQTNGFGSSVTGPYRFGSDPVLKRYIRLMYEREVKGKSLRAVRSAERSRHEQRLTALKRMLGYLLESHVKYCMVLWDDRKVDGTVFGAPEPVPLATNEEVYDTLVKTAGERAYQLDVVAFPRKLENAVWAVECRYRNRKAARKDIEKFAAALDALKAERDLAAVQGWFVSVEGFTADALDALEAHGIYYSGKDELNMLLEAFGLRRVAT